MGTISGSFVGRTQNGIEICPCSMTIAKPLALHRLLLLHPPLHYYSLWMTVTHLTMLCQSTKGPPSQVHNFSCHCDQFRVRRWRIYTHQAVCPDEKYPPKEVELPWHHLCTRSSQSRTHQYEVQLKTMSLFQKDWVFFICLAQEVLKRSFCTHASVYYYNVHLLYWKKSNTRFQSVQHGGSPTKVNLRWGCVDVRRDRNKSRVRTMTIIRRLL